VNTFSSTLPSKRAVVLLVIAAALAFMLWEQQSLSETRSALAKAEADRTELNLQIAAARDEKETSRRELSNQRKLVETTRASLAEAERQLAQVDPEALWATPPDHSPAWDENSPYVWVSKSMLPKLPLAPFTKKAELRGELAATLALNTTALRNLNRILTGLLQEYQQLEAAHAELVEEPLPGISEDGHLVTVRVTPFPTEGEQLKRQFEEVLRTTLGEQRAELLLQSASGWLDSQFSLSGSEPKTISVMLHPDGTYDMSTRTGNSWFSTGGFRQLDEYVPGHLIPLFTDALTHFLPDTPADGADESHRANQ
jgi:hypothetical protein